MFKLLIVLPMLLAGFIALCVGGLVLLPLLALVPGLIAVFAGVFAVALVLAVVAMLLRLLAAVVVGVGGLAIGLVGIGFLLAGGAIVLALGVALAHLLLPLLLIFGLIWLIRRSSRAPAPPLQISHG
ncbi:MAG: hypothetical protein P4L92_13250 [Rudaea sp.]|nr:hypothetical protein [Rudaea sp.]